MKKVIIALLVVASLFAFVSCKEAEPEVVGEAGLTFAVQFGERDKATTRVFTYSGDTVDAVLDEDGNYICYVNKSSFEALEEKINNATGSKTDAVLIITPTLTVKEGEEAAKWAWRYDVSADAYYTDSLVAVNKTLYGATGIRGLAFQSEDLFDGEFNATLFVTLTKGGSYTKSIKVIAADVDAE